MELLHESMAASGIYDRALSAGKLRIRCLNRHSVKYLVNLIDGNGCLPPGSVILKLHHLDTLFSMNIGSLVWESVKALMSVARLAADGVEALNNKIYLGQ